MPDTGGNMGYGNADLLKSAGVTGKVKTDTDATSDRKARRILRKLSQVKQDKPSAKGFG